MGYEFCRDHVPAAGEREDRHLGCAPGSPSVDAFDAVTWRVSACALNAIDLVLEAGPGYAHKNDTPAIVGRNTIWT